MCTFILGSDLFLYHFHQSLAPSGLQLTMTVPTLDSLPYELVLRIIETTPFESLLDLAVTSRAFPNPVAVVLYKSVSYGTFKTK